jgi:hypothetical protein
MLSCSWFIAFENKSPTSTISVLSSVIPQNWRAERERQSTSLSCLSPAVLQPNSSYYVWQREIEAGADLRYGEWGYMPPLNFVVLVDIVSYLLYLQSFSSHYDLFRLPLKVLFG